MLVSLTRRGWSFVLAAGGFGVAGLFVRLRDFWYLPAFLIAVPVVAVLTVLLLRATARLEVHLTASDPTPSVGSTVALSATITHRLPIALDARVNWVLGGATASADVMLPRATSQRAPSHQIVQQWIALLRGPASVGIRAVWIIDPLGMATARVTCDERASLKGALVLPRLLDFVPDLHEPYEPDEPDEPHEYSAAESQPHTRGGQGTEVPVGAMREYRPGDAKRMVDWKQSARQSKLLVRIAESDDVRVRRISIATEPAAYRSAEEFELAVSEAATVAVEWLRSGDAVQLVIDRDPPLDFVGENDLLRRLAHVTLRPGAHAAS